MAGLGRISIAIDPLLWGSIKSEWSPAHSDQQAMACPSTPRGSVCGSIRIIIGAHRMSVMRRLRRQARR